MVDTRVKPKLTADDLAKLPKGMGKRYELIEGELITLAPTKLPHGYVAFNAAVIIGFYNRQHKFGRAFGAETGFYTRGNQYTVRAPDAAIISYQRLPASPMPDDFGSVAPELVVEVVSPSDRKSGLEQKVQEWHDFGVLIVIVAYPRSRQVKVYRKGEEPQTLKGNDIFDGGDVLPGFSTPVSAFFED